jgi:hypothetical protein
MRTRTRSLFVFLLLLLPSAQFAWRNRDMPEFGYLHDDGLFFVSARSLATDNGYRVPSLPENPAQTKFPPLYPLYLSIVWRLNPSFPENLVLATLFSWLLLPACLALCWRLYRSYGYTERRTWLLVALLALNPYMILFGSSMFSEIFFTCCVLATLLAVERGGTKMIAAAGLAAGAAYLSRTAGIALLVSVPASLAVWSNRKRELRRAAVFAAAMLPAGIGWMVWTALDRIRTDDPTLLYYTDYVRYQFLNVGFGNIAVVVWKNLDQILYGLGALVLPKVFEGGVVKILTQVIAVAMIAGVVRMVKPKNQDSVVDATERLHSPNQSGRIAITYAWFAVVSTGILLVWHFPPNERFMLPIYPLMLAGLVTELEHLVAMLKRAFRHKDFSQRVVAGGLSVILAAVLGTALALQFYMSFAGLGDLASEKRTKLADRRAAYSWIAANLPPDAKVLSYDDPLLYLYSGHTGNYLPLLPRWWYSQDHASIVNAYRDLAAYCRGRGLEYVYFTSDDLSRETGDDDREAIGRLIAGNPELTPYFHFGIGTLYRVR